MKKRRKFILCLALSVLSSALAIGATTVAFADETGGEVTTTQSNSILYDEETDISLGTADTNGITGTERYSEYFKYVADGTGTAFAAEEASTWFTKTLAANTALVLTFDKVNAAQYPTMTLRISLGTWNQTEAEKLLLFGTQTTLSADTAVASQAFSINANEIKEIKLPTAEFADEQGEISSLTLLRTIGAGQVFVDYIRFDQDAWVEAESIVYDGASSDIVLGTAATNGITGTEVYSGNFGYIADGVNTPYELEESSTWFTGSLAANTALVLTFEGVNAAKYPTMTLRISVGAWTQTEAEKLLLFGTQTTLSADTAVATCYFNKDANDIKEIKLPTADLANGQGKVSSLTLLRTVGAGQVFIDYIRFDKDAWVEAESVIYDEVASDIVLGTANTNGITGTEVYSGIFGYIADGTDSPFEAEEASTWFTGSLAVNTALVLRFGDVDAKTYPILTIRIAVGSWSDEQTKAEELLLFGTQTTLSAETAAVKESFANKSNDIKEIKILTADIAGKNGKVSSLTFMRTVGVGQVFIDYIRFDKETAAEESVYLQGGLTVTGINPDKIDDNNVTWVALKDHGEPFESYGYVEHPAYITYNSENLPDFEVVNADTQKPLIQAKNVVQAIHVGLLKASDFAEFRLTYFFTDWAFGYHDFYIYGSGTTAFTDSNGTPTGYAAYQSNHGASSKHQIKITDLSLLANENGYIDYIYILYAGEANGVGCQAGDHAAQLWINEITFLLEKDVPVPVVSDEYISKDLAELLPIGDGFTFTLTTSGLSDGDEGFGAMQSVASSQLDTADAITFNFTPTYADGAKYSFYFLLKAKADADHTQSGIVFWFADDYILIGNGVKNDYEQLLKADFPAGTFVSGSTTKLTLAAIPYYVENIFEGYYLAVYVNGSQTPLLEKYVSDSECTLGDHTTVLMQDLGKNYSVRLTSAAETPVSADEVMKVSVATSSGKLTFTKPRAVLALSHFYVAGEIVSDIVIEGDATYNASTKTLTFGSEGTVKVYYTVTNVFGTFTSNELTLVYDDGIDNNEPDSTAESAEGTQQGCAAGCKSGIQNVWLGGALLIIASATFIFKKKKDE